MVVTAKELRLKTSDVLKRVRKGNAVTVTLRGKPVARIVSLAEKSGQKDISEFPAIGMWADRKDMKDPSAWVRKIRKPQYSIH